MTGKNNYTIYLENEYKSLENLVEALSPLLFFGRHFLHGKSINSLCNHLSVRSNHQ